MAIFIGDLFAKLKRFATQISDALSNELFESIWNKEIKSVILTLKCAKIISLACLTALLAIGSVWAYMSFFNGVTPLKKKQVFQATGSQATPAADSVNNQVPEAGPVLGEEPSRSDQRMRGHEVSRGRIGRDDRYLLARVIEGEASGEPMEGKIAVGAVIVNRTGNEDFPKDIRGVVYQPLAFEAVSNGIYMRPVSGESLRAADLAIGGQDPTDGAIYYWNPATASSKWVWQRPIVKSIGRHVFAK